MERLQLAARITAFIVLPASIAYTVYAVQNPGDHVGRMEGLIRAALAVGALAWILLYASRILAELSAAREVARGRVRVLQQSTVALPTLPPTPDALPAPDTVEAMRRLARRVTS